MDWKCHWKATTITATITSRRTRRIIAPSQCFPLLLYCLLLVLMISPIRTSNNACDWTGSGLSTSYADREIVSIYLRCTAGKIVWNYPKGAIRVLLRSPIGLHRNFHACLKIHPTRLESTPQRSNRNSTIINDLTHGNRIARIFLEGPKRLISLYDNNDHQIVKCFRSINEQVALYVEAEETPFENLQTVFEYNLEFINNKHHSIRPLVTKATSNLHHFADTNTGERSTLDHRSPEPNELNHVIVEIDEHDVNDENDRNDTWWWWRWGTKDPIRKNTKITDHSNNKHRKHASRGNGEEIIGALGESWEICRPCTDTEMANAYCSSDIVTRGTIYSVQEQPTLNTIEIGVKQTKILRNNMVAMSDAEDIWRHYYKTSKSNSLYSRENNRKIRHSRNRDGISSVSNTNRNDDNDQIVEFKFHTPSHCSASHGIGEFVFMGRRRFDEIMLICAPRLDEWVLIARKFNDTNSAPCILHS